MPNLSKLDGKEINQSDRIEIMDLVLEELCPEEKKDFMNLNQEIFNEISSTGSYPEEYSKAYDHANNVWSFHNSLPLDPEIENQPEIIEAKKVASRIGSTLSPELNKNVQIATQLLTIYLMEALKSFK